jgi:hypothetical protein
MALALETCVPRSPVSTVGDWVKTLAAEPLARRSEIVAAVEMGAPGLSLDQFLRPEEHDSPRQAIPPAPDVASASLRPDSRAPRTRPFLLAAAGVAIVVTTVWAFARARHDEHVTAPPSETATDRRRDPPVATIAASDPGEGEDEASPEATTAATATAKPGTSPRAHRGVSGVQSPAGSASAHRPASQNCEPPFTYDAKGRKVYRRDCL